MSEAIEKSTLDEAATVTATPQHPSEETDFAEEVAEMVTEHAPRLFAVVLVHEDAVDARIAAWGIELDEAAYMTTVDGGSHYALADAESALKYIHGNSR